MSSLTPFILHLGALNGMIWDLLFMNIKDKRNCLLEIKDFYLFFGGGGGGGSS